MTDQPVPAKKTPWLFIALGGTAVLCLCAIVIGVGGFALFSTSRSVSVTNEEPIEPSIVEATPELDEPTAIPQQGNDNPLVNDAAPAGTAVDIGNNMTLAVLDVTRPADDIGANGNSFNTTAPDSEEFIQVNVTVTCSNDGENPCTFYPTVMKVVLADGSSRDLQTFIEGVDDWDTSVEIDGGETQPGILLFIVPKSETSLVVSYQDIYADQALYLQLP
jgi:hypothetical protein